MFQPIFNQIKNALLATSLLAIVISVVGMSLSNYSTIPTQAAPVCPAGYVINGVKCESRIAKTGAPVTTTEVAKHLNITETYDRTGNPRATISVSNTPVPQGNQSYTVPIVVGHTISFRNCMQQPNYTVRFFMRAWDSTVSTDPGCEIIGAPDPSNGRSDPWQDFTAQRSFFTDMSNLATNLTITGDINQSLSYHTRAFRLGSGNWAEHCVSFGSYCDNNTNSYNDYVSTITMGIPTTSPTCITGYTDTRDGTATPCLQVATISSYTCPAGQYLTTPNTDSCTPCTANSYCLGNVNAVATPCPTGFVSSVGSTSAAACSRSTLTTNDLTNGSTKIECNGAKEVTVNSKTTCTFDIQDKALPTDVKLAIGNGDLASSSCVANGSKVTCANVTTGSQTGDQPIIVKIGANPQADTNQKVKVTETKTFVIPDDFKPTLPNDTKNNSIIKVSCYDGKEVVINSTTSCSFDIGNKTLPDNTKISIGNGDINTSTCKVNGSKVTCTNVSTGSQAGEQPLYIKIGTGDKVNTNQTVKVSGDTSVAGTLVRSGAGTAIAGTVGTVAMAGAGFFFYKAKTKRSTGINI